VRKFNTNTPAEEEFLRIKTDISGAVIRITDIELVDNTNIILSGFYRLDEDKATLEYVNPSQNEVNDVLLNTGFQTNIFVMSVNLSTFGINWARYIVGLQNVFPLNFNAKILLTENKTKLICASYVRTENQRITIYKRVVNGAVISYTQDQTILGTDQNDTNEFVLCKFDVSTGEHRKILSDYSFFVHQQ